LRHPVLRDLLGEILMPQPNVRVGAVCRIVKSIGRACPRSTILATALAAIIAAPTAEGAESLPSALATLKQVGHQAAGNRAATQAWAIVAAADTAQMPTILAALDDADPLTANYLGSAIDAVAERALAKGQKLPHDELQQFVLDPAHTPRSRRLAFDWLAKVDPTAPDRLIPGFLNDPCLELRREAVARLFTEGTRLVENAASHERKRAAGIAVLRRAFEAARDLDQIERLDEELTKLKQEVDLSRHFGFITSWQLIGPFENRNGVGFDAVYPPEKQVDFSAHYPGKLPEVSWLAYTSTDRKGIVDLNQALGKDMGCAGYAAAEFYGSRKQEVDMRWGSANASKLWVNGKLIAQHQVYHTGAMIDQYQSRVTLQPGRNLILLKICQNEQTQKWAQVWEFQFRICDAIGTAIHSIDERESVKAKP
jgi:hypothetical protein